MRKLAIWVVVVLAVVGVSKAALEQYVLHGAREVVKAKLTDPDSAVFRNESMLGGIFNGVVCGEVNAKNQTGGYVGYKEFFVVVSKLQALDFGGELSRDQLSSDHVKEICNKALEMG